MSSLPQSRPSDGDAPKPAWSRRDVFGLGGSFGALLAIGSLPVFAAGSTGLRLSNASFVSNPTQLWYTTPAVESSIISQGLPIGNGRIGALVTGDPSNDVLYLSDATLWTGTLNGSLGSDGQFPYDSTNFGSFQLLAKLYLGIPAHTASSITNYTRRLDLSNGYVSASYQKDGVTYTRAVYASHPDDVVVVRLTQSGGGSYTGTVSLNGTHTNDTTTASAAAASFSGALANGLKYAAAVNVAHTGGSIGISGSSVTFTGCTEVVIVLTGGTNYTPDAAKSFMDATVDPRAIATTKASAAAAVAGGTLFATHVADYQSLYNTMSVNLGTSTPAQQAKDTASRLQSRGTSTAPAAADPELEAMYLQFGRYLTITGSRSSLPTNLQGLWLDHNGADQWMGDYHTDINLQMNYWLPDRASLSPCFDTLTDYCLSQLPSWTTQTQKLFNDPRNTMYRNSSGESAQGWTTAISANIFGGLGWEWHPAGNAWLCNSLFEHYEYIQDSAYLAKIYDMLKGACRFWETRLVSKTITVAGRQVTVLVDDADWSPEQGAHGQQGITYAQELVWQLFENYRKACNILTRDATYAATIKGLQDNLYLPQVSTTVTPNRLQEWMDPNTWGDLTHRHLSPLVGLFPGDRINKDTSPTALVDGAQALLTARGLSSFGWATAWRSLCWSRLKNADSAYQTVLNVIGTSSTAANLFDMYSSTTFQIDANYGTPSAMLDMLLYSRPGLIELLPALPSAWSSGSVTGIGARGGFTVDLAWSAGAVTSATLHSVNGTATVVRSGSWSQVVVVPAGGSVTVTPSGTSTVCFLTNRQSGKVIDVPGSSKTAGQSLIQYPRQGSDNEKWLLSRVDNVYFTITNVSSGMLVDVQGGSTADGAPIIQWTATSGSNQHWRLDDAGGGYVKIVSQRSGKVLAIDADSNIVQQADNGSTSQHWLLQT
ncbi:glycosyl hydrolase family 95 catalytic domain-containing protein [Actinomadura oligospora]|uniref:glycosyl hydrolase family 95 catalytic domain-containing protein n=1 Tax=Actinomadura oligospora TaxID=111804 RepID=UPI00047981CC|nr:glycoside hydrolase N-terminal domain-containing protein [Actinomadura oligospora]